MPAATKAQTPKFDLTTNIPATMEIRFVDVWPDRNGYGSQVSLKGAIDGEPAVTYLKGKTWANLKALHAAGVIGDYDKAIEEPAEKVNVPVLNGSHVTLCRRQLAGEKYATLVVETEGVVSRETGTPSTPGRTASVKQPVEMGGPIPGLDDLPDEPPPVDEAFAETAPKATDKLNAVFALYDVCFDHAASIAKRHHALNPDVSAMAATLYINASNRGIVV